MSIEIGTVNGLDLVERPRAVELSREDLEVLRATVFKGASDAQLQLYARNCQARGLDPFAKEIYAWAGRDGAVEIVVGIDGLRNLAESTGQYRGQLAPLYCGEDGQWTDVWLQKAPPLAAKVTVLRQGYEPSTAVALLAEYKKNTPPWNTMPTVMLAKAAEAQAIRRLFPRQTTGLYVQEEMPEPGDEPPRRAPLRPDVRLPRAEQEANLEALAPSPRAPEPVTVEVVDTETGEITEQPVTKEDLGERIKMLREALGWTVEDVRKLATAQNPPVSLRNVEGLAAVAVLLEEQMRAEDERRAGSADDGDAIDVEFAEFAGVARDEPHDHYRG